MCSNALLVCVYVLNRKRKRERERRDGCSRHIRSPFLSFERSERRGERTLYLLDNEAASPFWHILVCTYVCACFDKKKIYILSWRDEISKSPVFFKFYFAVLLYFGYIISRSLFRFLPSISTMYATAINYTSFVFTRCARFLTGNA